MDEFYSIYSHGLVRVAACTLPVAPANPMDNARHTAELIRECDLEGVALAAFPELGLTGYSIDDLLLQDTLLDAALQAIEHVRQATVELQPIVVVGAPLAHANRLYNCAVVIHAGRILGVVPKSYLPDYREFYEKRHFAPGDGLAGAAIRLPGVALRPEAPSTRRASHRVDAFANYGVAPDTVPFGPDLLFDAKDVPGFTFHVEVCEDMWVPIPPSARAALAGATVLVNLSSSPITVGRAADRALMVQSASARCNAAYVYTASGEGESSTDLSWDGQSMVYELGVKLAESERFASGRHATIADVDVDALRQERLRQGSFDDNRTAFGVTASPAGAPPASVGGGADVFRTVTLTLNPDAGGAVGLRRPLDRFPFVPDDEAQLNQDCYEAYNIQVYAIAQRLKAIGDPKIVIGVSGGLDSTHALIVAAKAMDRLGRPRTDVLAYTMPGFATSPGARRPTT